MICKECLDDLWYYSTAKIGVKREFLSNSYKFYNCQRVPTCFDKSHKEHTCFITMEEAITHAYIVSGDDINTLKNLTEKWVDERRNRDSLK